MVSWSTRDRADCATAVLCCPSQFVSDPSQFGSLVLFWGTEHTGACPHKPQDRHRAECASVQSGRAGPSLKQILMTPFQSTVLAISKDSLSIMTLSLMSATPRLFPKLFQGQPRFTFSFTVKHCNELGKPFRNLNTSWFHPGIEHQNYS